MAEGRSNTKHSDGRTALMHAVIDGKDELIKLLIARDSDINAQDNETAAAPATSRFTCLGAGAIPVHHKQ